MWGRPVWPGPHELSATLEESMAGVRDEWVSAEREW